LAGEVLHGPHRAVDRALPGLNEAAQLLGDRGGRDLVGQALAHDLAGVLGERAAGIDDAVLPHNADAAVGPIDDELHGCLLLPEELSTWAEVPHPPPTPSPSGGEGELQ